MIRGFLYVGATLFEFVLNEIVEKVSELIFFLFLSILLI